MNFDNPSTELLFSTARIQNKNGQGTRFFISIPTKNENNIPILVTNHHVIRDTRHIHIDFFKLDIDNKKPITDEKLTVEIDTNPFLDFQSENLDIAFIPIAPIIEQLAAKKVQLFFKAVTTNIACSSEQEAELGSIEDVTFIGYPYGLQEKSNNLPIIRRGITATPVWSNFSQENHNENFLIDAGVFPGSSGSPVFIYNHGDFIMHLLQLLLGILSGQSQF